MNVDNTLRLECKAEMICGVFLFFFFFLFSFFFFFFGPGSHLETLHPVLCGLLILSDGFALFDIKEAPPPSRLTPNLH
jgi:hypothetical protein